MNWAASTTLKPTGLASNNYGSMGNLQPIPEEDESSGIRSPLPTKWKPIEREIKPQYYVMKSTAPTAKLNPRAIFMVFSLPAILFLFFLFIFILRANAPLPVMLWRDCARGQWPKSNACVPTNTLAVRATTVVQNLTWSEKLTQCQLRDNALPRLNISSFPYCQESMFKQLMQLHPTEFAPIDMKASCKQFHLRTYTPITTLRGCKNVIKSLVEDGLLLSLYPSELAVCAKYPYTAYEVAALDDILVRLLAGRILADESHEVRAGGIILGGPESFHAGIPKKYGIDS
ncbi:hypothetical protein SDRG_05922 [Saprolegnia diclina VS20]|uniref:Uncharacterized protein n=1 Tax=Saprolegnia diclina (strain VS20) TaxID=1156394 RepID=T0RVM9_SAPDV|nr:hypothetical protein SDRG_05922 [Saprolegnia diclina VS20]EQC36468.1 hypothetical protein SDRG_05922 [Saprolegnia diclina VS20]|eukprot:XP_008609889.1 hypothetical protein SDRG_05922 [Saprolegnia diclina VS20]